MDGFKNSTRMKYMDEGISSRPTDSSGRRATDADLGITPGGQTPKKAKPVGPSSAAVSKVLAGTAKKALPAGGIGGAAAGAAGAAGAALAGAAARAARQRSDAALLQRTPGAAMTEGERRAILAATKKAVPSYSDRPVIRRNKGGLMAMPKGKC